MSDLPTWDIDLIEQSVLRVSAYAKLRGKDRQRVERYLPMLKDAHGDLLNLISRYAGPGAVELARRHLRMIEISAFFLGIATHVSDSAEDYVKTRSVNGARSSKEAYDAAKERDLLHAIIDEAIEQGMRVRQSKKCAENLLAGSERKDSKGVRARLPSELVRNGWPSSSTIQRTIRRNLRELEAAGVTKDQ
jgi:hypothetical protein